MRQGGVSRQAPEGSIDVMSAHRRRAHGEGKSRARDGSAQIILGVAVAAGKLWAAELQNSLHLRASSALGEQFARDPIIDDAPVRLRKALGDVPSPQAM